MYEGTLPDSGRPLPFDWRPVTIRTVRRATVTTGVRDLKAHLSAALRMTSSGTHRDLVHRHKQLLAALVPLPDYWFIAELEAALKNRGWQDRYPFLNGNDVAEALDHLRPAPLDPRGEPDTRSPTHPSTLAEAAVWWETVEPVLRRQEERA